MSRLNERSLTWPAVKKSRVTNTYYISIKMAKYSVPFETHSKSAEEKPQAEKGPMTEKPRIPFLLPAAHSSLNQFKIATKKAMEFIEKAEKSVSQVNQASFF